MKEEPDHSARGCAAPCLPFPACGGEGREGGAPSLKAISAPPLGISRDFEDHGRTRTAAASPARCGVTPKRDQLANTVATKKTDKNADQRDRCEFHDKPAPAGIPYYRAS